jgi:hypothetical protein
MTLSYARRTQAGKVKANIALSIVAPERLSKDHPTGADVLFDAYCASARRAQASLNLRDGVEAGRAWARFLDAFQEAA